MPAVTFNFFLASGCDGKAGNANAPRRCGEGRAHAFSVVAVYLTRRTAALAGCLRIQHMRGVIVAVEARDIERTLSRSATAVKGRAAGGVRRYFRKRAMWLLSMISVQASRETWIEPEYGVLSSTISPKNRPIDAATSAVIAICLK